MGTATLTRTDEQIQAEVLVELKWDAQVQPNGWVTRRGEVEWPVSEAGRRAGRSSPDGCQGSHQPDHRQVGSDGFGTQEEIHDALIRSVELDANKISVEFQDYEAILKGTVRSWAEREEAERAAWFALGITSVKNLITIES